MERFFEWTKSFKKREKEILNDVDICIYFLVKRTLHALGPTTRAE